MSAFSDIRRVAVVAPHADDEVLGCGGTIARLVAEGARVDVITMTRGYPPDFTDALAETVAGESREAHRLLGVHESHFLGLPAARLDQVPHSEVNAALSQCLDGISPDTLFVPFVGDIHLDHRIAFTAALVWARPRGLDAPRRIWAYETLSETNWWAPGITPAFVPNCFIDIGDHLDAKVRAFGAFRSQVKAFPDERSFETIRAQAIVRGSTVHRRAAEAFMVIREIL